MRKLVLTVGLLLLSANTFAASTLPPNFGSTILNAVNQNGSTLKILKTTFPMVYGGQDISRARVATADLSVWSGEKVIIG